MNTTGRVSGIAAAFACAFCASLAWAQDDPASTITVAGEVAVDCSVGVGPASGSTGAQHTAPIEIINASSRLNTTQQSVGYLTWDCNAPFSLSVSSGNASSDPGLCNDPLVPQSIGGCLVWEDGPDLARNSVAYALNADTVTFFRDILTVGGGCAGPAGPVGGRNCAPGEVDSRDPGQLTFTRMETQIFVKLLSTVAGGVNSIPLGGGPYDDTLTFTITAQN